MTFEFGDIKTSQEIFYYLLQHHELREDKEQKLYRAYFENENIQMLVKSQGEASECKIERYGNTIYLIPDEGNTYLGFSKSQLKKLLCKSDATDKDYYLAQFVILTLLIEFYDGQGSSAKTRDYIRVGELLNSVSERLKEGADRMDEDEQDRVGIAFSDMLTAYEALKSDENGRKTKTTKEGFIHNILVFLENQGLIEYVVADEMVLTTKKLDNFMYWNILNENNYRRVLTVLGVNDDVEA
jgi:hypothetical protein